jgi:hypothetical protein
MQIKNIQEAINMANEIERYEGALKQMKDALKKFVEANGPVDTGDKVWDFSDSVSWDFAPEKLKELAAEILMMGHNPWELMSIGSRELAKTGLTERALEQYGQKKITRRFASKKSVAQKSA